MYVVVGIRDVVHINKYICSNVTTMVLSSFLKTINSSCLKRGWLEICFGVLGVVCVIN